MARATPVLIIRGSRPDDTDRLREIAVASKGHWGYDRARLADWASRLDFSDAALPGRDVFVAVVDEDAVAWAALLEERGEWWLDDLWVDPPAMGRGVGTALFHHVAQVAASRGAARLRWESEPNAVGFYEKLGAVHTGETRISSWGRELTLMEIPL